MCSAGAPSLMMINLMPEESCRRQLLAQGLKARSKLSGRQRKQRVQRPRGQRELSTVTNSTFKLARAVAGSMKRKGRRASVEILLHSLCLVIILAWNGEWVVTVEFEEYVKSSK